MWREVERKVVECGDCRVQNGAWMECEKSSVENGESMEWRVESGKWRVKGR